MENLLLSAIIAFWKVGGFILALTLARQLNERYDLSRFGVISITGGGGKTSLLYSLGRFFSQNERVLVTSTAKMFPPNEGQCDLFISGSAALLADKAQALKTQVLVMAMKDKIGEKLDGYNAYDIDTICEAECFDKIIIEADGSRGVSFKIYEKWEPPVPKQTECQIVVLGADALLYPVSLSTVFRLDDLTRKYGVQKGEIMSMTNIAAILSSKNEYLKNSPDAAYKILLVNKGELFSDSCSREEIVSTLRSAVTGYNVVAAVSAAEDCLY